jgi:hypothetical protein
MGIRQRCWAWLRIVGSVSARFPRRAGDGCSQLQIRHRLHSTDPHRQDRRRLSGGDVATRLVAAALRGGTVHRQIVTRPVRSTARQLTSKHEASGDFEMLAPASKQAPREKQHRPRNGSDVGALGRISLPAEVCLRRSSCARCEPDVVLQIEALRARAPLRPARSTVSTRRRCSGEASAGTTFFACIDRSS